jgi:hypothetical protein
MQTPTEAIRDLLGVHLKLLFLVCGFVIVNARIR